jgi:hypothetical protein
VLVATAVGDLLLRTILFRLQKINKYSMKILDILCETTLVIDENKHTNIPFIDGTIWLGDHFSQRTSERGGDETMRRALRLFAKFNQLPLKNEIAAVPPENKETFVLYEPSYFGISILKKLETLPSRNPTTAYVLKTVGDNLYPMEGQKLYMLDSQPRRFNRNDYQNFPLDVKRYMIQTWNRNGFSKKEIEQIRTELAAKGVKL